MSWNDPCSECGNPRYSCECKIEPYTEEQLKKWTEERKQLKQGEEICKQLGHVWQYGFIIYHCSRCGANSDY